MLTRMRFKNWRSLKSETIDFTTPITVFIGANSSGKTNLLDALYFIRQAAETGVDTTPHMRDWENKILTIGRPRNEPTEVEFSFSQATDKPLLTYNFCNEYSEDGFSSWFSEKLSDDEGRVWLKSNMGFLEALETTGDITKANLSDDELGLSAFGRTSRYSLVQSAFQYVTQRWQMLDEGFSPHVNVPAGSSSDFYVLDRCAHNLPAVLEFMQSRFPQIFSDLQEDLLWLLEHTEAIKTEKNDRETRLSLREEYYPNKEAPTLSAGTGRIVAMLTAYYALDMRKAEMPGLVVIEEPDTALNPGLLRNFVEQLRNYTSREGHPRQFILTTHNPYLLNFFKPEEVRVVERDEQGYTHVHKIPDFIDRIWLDEYGLGEVWTTNSFGGLPK